MKDVNTGNVALQREKMKTRQRYWPEETVLFERIVADSSVQDEKAWHDALKASVAGRDADATRSFERWLQHAAACLDPKDPLHLVRKDRPMTLVVHGETGTGKSHFARALLGMSLLLFAKNTPSAQIYCCK